MLKLTSTAQTYQYHPFPTTTATWKYELTDFDGNHMEWWFDSYIISGTGTIDTLSSDLGAFYEENKRIYFKYHSSTSPTFDCVLHFNLTLGDSVERSGQYYYVTSDDSVSINFDNRRVLEIENYGTWVEGIGNVSSTYFAFEPISFGAIWEPYHLRCLLADGHSILHENCDAVSVLDVSEERIGIGPNPTDGLVRFNKSVRLVRVYNSLGKELTPEITIDHESNTADLTHLTSGLYFCQLTLPNDKEITLRIIKN